MAQNPPPGTETAPPPPAPPPPDPELEKLRAQNAEQTKALALAQARLDFPNADKDMLAIFQGTPEDLRKFAEVLHTKEAERLKALPSGGPGPAPTPGPGGTPTPGDEALRRYNELRPKVLGKYAEPHEAVEFEQLAYSRVWNQHMADRKDGKSSSDGVRY